MLQRLVLHRAPIRRAVRARRALAAPSADRSAESRLARGLERATAWESLQALARCRAWAPAAAALRPVCRAWAPARRDHRPMARRARPRRAVRKLPALPQAHPAAAPTPARPAHRRPVKAPPRMPLRRKALARTPVRRRTIVLGPVPRTATALGPRRVPPLPGKPDKAGQAQAPAPLVRVRPAPAPLVRARWRRRLKPRPSRQRQVSRQLANSTQGTLIIPRAPAAAGRAVAGRAAAGRTT